MPRCTVSKTLKKLKYVYITVTISVNRYKEFSAIRVKKFLTPEVMVG
jgi:hypothetical protein